MSDIHHVTFACRGCQSDVIVAGVTCNGCSSREGITVEEWEIVRAAVGNNEAARAIVDRALRKPQPDENASTS